MMRNCAARVITATYAVALLVALAGCATRPPPADDPNVLFAQGRYEEGLQRLKKLSDENPRNVEYRVNYEARREGAVTQLTARADTALRQGRLTDAEKAFGQIVSIDPSNQNAVSGLAAVSTQRRHRDLLQQAEKLLKAGTAPDVAQAAEITRTVLAENAGNKEARSLNTRISEHRAKAARPAEQQLAASFRKPITLEFRDAPLKSVFDMISRVSGLNFFFDKDVRADLRATILARNTSIEDAVKILLATNQLERKVLNENSVLIYPNTPQKLKEYQSLTIRTFYLVNADVKAVSNTLKTILKTRDLVIDERLGLIVMRDTPEAIRLAERLIALQDMGDAEVMLEVEVLEVARSRLLELGIRWPSQVSFEILPTPDTVTVNTLRNLNSEAIGVTIGPTTLNARRDDTDGALLANPRIRVRNREKARFVIGERVPVITTTATSTGFVSDSVSYLDVGLKVEVEPTIYLEDEVGIRVALEVSNLLSEVRSRAGTLAYQIGTRNASTALRLKDGETQILAGLINHSDRVTANKVPGLGALPILGRLFGSRKDEVASSEIVLLITPRIMRSIRPPDLMEAEFDSGTEATLGSRGLAITAPDPASSAPAGARTKFLSTIGSPIQPSAVKQSRWSGRADGSTTIRPSAQSLTARKLTDSAGGVKSGTG